MNKTVLSLLGVLALAAGCAHRQIPGSNIDDTRDNRAILEVMERYRTAVEAKDVKGIQSLLDPSFKDNGGSADPAEHLDYQTVPQKLAERFSKLADVKLDMEVRKITVHDDNTASAVYHYDTHFVVVSANERKPESDSDLKEMELRRDGDDWKILSGI